MKTVTIKIKLKNDVPPYSWEKIEDIIGDVLAKFGLKGSIENNATNNTTKIRQIFK